MGSRAKRKDGFLTDPEQVDVLIVGGGPAGLTAAIYLSRFHLRTLVVDAGDSRAGIIPLSRNHAGYPEGISGADLIARMRRQAEQYGTIIRTATVTAIEHVDDGFVAAADRRYRANAVLIATGVTNRRPPMDDALHAEALAAGRLRYCPICDAYEVTDQRVGVIGTSERGVKEAMFLRSYTADVTLVAPAGPHDLDAEQRRRLAESGISVVDAMQLRFALGDDTIEIFTEHDHTGFDVLPPFVAYMPNRLDHAGRQAQLNAYAERLRTIDATPRLFFHPADDYGMNERLKPGVLARSGVQRNV